MRLTMERLERAKILVHALGDEKQRWSEEVKRLAHLLDEVQGTVLASAAACTFLGESEGRWEEKEGGRIRWWL